jgi:chromate transport protein ChrA
MQWDGQGIVVVVASSIGWRCAGTPGLTTVWRAFIGAG